MSASLFMLKKTFVGTSGLSKEAVTFSLLPVPLRGSEYSRGLTHNGLTALKPGSSIDFTAEVMLASIGQFKSSASAKPCILNLLSRETTSKLLLTSRSTSSTLMLLKQTDSEAIRHALLDQ